MQGYKSQKVWQVAQKMAVRVYEATRLFPREEQPGLALQMRRCATMIPCNVAEACNEDGEFDGVRSLDRAISSAKRLDYLLQLGRDLEYVTAKDHEELTGRLSEVRAMLKVHSDRMFPDIPF